MTCIVGATFCAEDESDMLPVLAGVLQAVAESYGCEVTDKVELLQGVVEARQGDNNVAKTYRNVVRFTRAGAWV